mgnify:CR=1 FL=1
MVGGVSYFKDDYEYNCYMTLDTTKFVYNMPSTGHI